VNLESWIASLPQDQANWLRKVLPPDARISDLERVQPQNDPQRRALSALRASIIGDLRRGPAWVVTEKSATPIGSAARAYTLRTAIAHGAVGSSAETLPGESFDETLAQHTIGQKHTVPEFVKLAEAFRSSARRLAPLMAIAGPRGHGKENAIQGFAKALFGETASVVRVDLSTATDNLADLLFGESGTPGDLSEAKLADIQDGRPKAVVHLTGLDNLKTRAPELTKRLLAQLLKTRGDQGYARVNFICDFDTPPEGGAPAPGTLLQDALGPAARPLPAAKAEFRCLGEEAMLQYADAMIQLLQGGPGLSRLRIELDLGDGDGRPDARAVLGRILATPHQPLEELEERIRQAIFAQFEKDGSANIAADAVMRVHVQPDFARQPQDLEQAITALREPGADLFQIARIFDVPQEGLLADDATRDALLEDGRELIDRTREVLAAIAAEEARYAPEYGRSKDLADKLDHAAAVLGRIGESLGDKRAPLAKLAKLGLELRGATNDADEALARLGRAGVARLTALGIALPIDEAVALRSTLGTLRYVSQGLAGLGQESASPKAIAQLLANVRGLGQQIEQRRQRLTELNGALLEGSLVSTLGGLTERLEASLRLGKERALEDVFPLLDPTEAEQLRADVGQVKASLADAAQRPGPSRTALVALSAAGGPAVFDDILARAERIATALGGLAEDRLTIAQLRAKELADSPEMKRQIARSLLRAEAGGDEADLRLVLPELVKLPVRVLKRLQQNQIPVVVIRGKLAEYLRLSEKDKNSTPPGYEKGKTWDDVPAIFTNRTLLNGQSVSEVVIITTAAGSQRAIKGLVPGGQRNSVIHEVLHAFDRNGVYSQSPQFLAACATDRATRIPYELQPVEDVGGGKRFDRGAAETFAITGERLYDGDDTVQGERPNLTAEVLRVSEDDPE
jgi:hypothetical protein